MRLPKISQREWLFLIGGAVLGYVVVPRIFHHIGVGDTGPTDVAGCPSDRTYTENGIINCCDVALNEYGQCPSN